MIRPLRQVQHTLRLDVLACALTALLAVACGDPAEPATQVTDPPALLVAPAARAAEVGRMFTADLAAGTFSDPTGRGLTYTITLSGPARGLSAIGSRLSGVPTEPGVVRGTLAARDLSGRSATT
jgi:hypothetical protein